jgi:hypothetical protein
MSVFQLSDDALILLANRIVENTLASPEVRDAMLAFGYDEAALQEGRALADVFSTTVRVRQDKHGRQVNATAAVGEAWDAFHTRTYMPHVTIARITFRDKGTLRRLGVNGPRSRRFAEYLKEARRFYTLLAEDNELLSAMSARGVTAERITEAVQALDALEALDQRKEDLKGRRQQSTRKRNDERRALAEWVSAYQKIARHALRDTPDYIEQFGVIAR